MKNITIRDSGNKEVLEAYFLNHEGQPYNLENKTVTFMENKDGDKFVSDPNVQIVNATAGFVRYTLQSQVHSAPGIAWFEINDDSGLVDSTGNFNIRVENGLRATADNTTYIAALEKLKQQMEALIRQADGELKTELQRAEQQLNQELQNFRNQYNSLSNDFQNQFKSAQNARQADYNKQKDAINADWFNTKNNINKNAQDTINAIKSNAKQVLDEDQADWNAKQKQWDSTFSAIVKEWQVKTNSLNATAQDLTNKFNTIIGQVSDLMNNKLPAMDSKTDAIQAKIDELRKELSNLNKIKLRTQSLDQSGNTFENIQTATKQSDGSYLINIFDNDWTANKVSWLLKNTDLSKVKIKLQSLDQNGDTFTNTQTATKQSDGSYVINTYDNDWTAKKVSWLLKNTKSYVNSIANLSDRLRSFTMQQDMFQHRVDYDNPSGTISDDTVDFNNYRETGILKVVNCLIQNGPYKSDNRHTVFLKITNLDGQTQYQTVYEGDNLYGRKLYNGSGQWHKYTNTPI